MTSPTAGSHGGGVCPHELRKRLLELQQVQDREQLITFIKNIREGIMVIVFILYLVLSRARIS